MPLIPFLTNSAPGTAIYAPAGSGGGGGGGGGPVLNVSTINFNSVGSDGNIPAQQNMRNGGDGAGGLGAFNGAVLAFDMDPGPVSTLLVGYNSANNALQISQNTNNIITSGALQVDAILCSTINGAVPGGGGGSSGSIAVSSITSFPGQTYPGPSTILISPGTGGNLAVSGYPTTANATGDIILDTGISANNLATAFQPGGNANAALILPTGLGGTYLNLGATDAGGALIAAVNSSGNGSTLTVVSDAVNMIQTIATGGVLSFKANDANLYDLSVSDSNANLIARASLGTVGGRNQFYTERGQVNDCMVSTITAVAGANITALKPLAVSSIIGVSTINGAAYPPSGASAQKLTWLNSGTNTLPSGGTPGTFVALTNASAAVTNGHTYRVTANFGLSNTVADGITELVIEGAGVGGLPATIAAIPNIVTGASAPFGGYSGYFTVAGTSGGGVTVSGVNTGSANTTVEGDNAFVILEDLGTI